MASTTTKRAITVPLSWLGIARLVATLVILAMATYGMMRLGQDLLLPDGLAQINVAVPEPGWKCFAAMRGEDVQAMSCWPYSQAEEGITAPSG